MTCQEFTLAIKAEKERLGLEPAGAARICGVSQRTMYYWQNGEIKRVHPVMMANALSRLRKRKSRAPKNGKAAQ